VKKIVPDPPLPTSALLRQNGTVTGHHGRSPVWQPAPVLPRGDWRRTHGAQVARLQASIGCRHSAPQFSRVRQPHIPASNPITLPAHLPSAICHAPCASRQPTSSPAPSAAVVAILVLQVLVLLPILVQLPGDLHVLLAIIQDFLDAALLVPAHRLQAVSRFVYAQCGFGQTVEADRKPSRR